MENWKTSLSVALIAAISAVSGSYVTGHYLIESNAQQIEANKEEYRLKLKVEYLENLIRLSSEYGGALEGLVNAGLTDPGNENKLMEHISTVQLKGTELILVTDDEIAQVVNSVNYYAAVFLKDRGTEKSQEALNKLGKVNVMLMKSLRALIQENYDFKLVTPSYKLNSQAN